jgi:hypothetical protein
VAGIRCVKRATPQLERIRNQHAGVEGRPRHGAAGGVSGGMGGHRTCVLLCPAFLERCKPRRALNGGVLHCRGGSTTSTALEKPGAASGVGPPRGERSWRGRCRSCPTGHSLVRCMHLDWVWTPTSRRGGVHASRTVVTRWFSRSHGCCLRRTRWIPGVWIILHSLWASSLG